MAAHVRLIAFRDPPDLNTLSNIPGLKAFRLFKRAERSEWHLEGPGGDTVRFFEQIKYAVPWAASRRAKDAFKRLSKTIKQSGLESWGLAEGEIVHALALSAELGQPTLLAYGNTGAGVDAGFICEAGEVAFAKLHALPEGMLVFDNGAARVEAPVSGEPDEDGEPVLDQFQFATEVANRFFNDNTRWRVSAHIADDDDGSYALVLAHGGR